MRTSKIQSSAIVVMWLVCVACAGVEVEAQNGTVAIASPRDGGNVGREVIVKGTAKLTNTDFLWVVARRVDFAPLWFLQRPVKVAPETGNWQATAAIGAGPQDVNWDFEIAAITVNKAGHEKLMAAWTTAMESGAWRPMRIPDTTSPPRVIKVHKSSHR
jgi:hypothetical protein